MSYYCDNPAKFYDEKLVKARKPHKCCETKREIQPGERYWRIRGMWEDDDKPSTFCQSEAAYHFARFLNGVGTPREYQEECIPFGGVAEHVRDMDDPDTTAEWERVCRGEVTRDTTEKPGGAA